MEVLIISILSAVLLAGAGFGIYWFVKKKRRAKQVERSPKLVPLLLKIPPRETSNENRDVREAIKENISKAEGIFRLLSGIASKKSRLYGQRYVAFEVVADAKQIYFYTAVPAVLLEPVKRAITSGSVSYTHLRAHET